MDTRDIAQERMSRTAASGTLVPARASKVSIASSASSDLSARALGSPAASPSRTPGGELFNQRLAQARQMGQMGQMGQIGQLGRVDMETVGARGTGPAAAAPLGVAEARVAEARVDPRVVTVQRGDTLTSLVRAQWAANRAAHRAAHGSEHGGTRETLGAAEAHRWAMQVARENGLSDPDRIRVGQTLVVGAPPVSRSAPAAAAVTAVAPIVRVDPSSARTVDHGVLNQTLDRAVDLGYIPAPERGAVRERIAELAGKHGFKPDDFAKAVLMESDGLNPRASNGRCYGIIQFCSGPDRGAASAGYAHRPQDILGLSVLQQLDLVDRYFDDTKLREFRGRDGRIRLDDLYLTILTPAARQERNPTAPLPIAGPQALDLHVRRERHAPITRSSILAGLHVNAKARLGQFVVAEMSAR